MILTASHISTASVTDAQIGACHKVFGPDNKPFYMVESASDSLKEYKVTWSREKGFQCQCRAAEFGKLCWHIRASIACAREEHTALAEIEAAIKAQAAQPVETPAQIDLATRARVSAANERQASKPVSKARATSPRAFSILKTA